MGLLRPTVRTKLTALYTGLFLASGTVLVTVVYLLMSQTIADRLSVAVAKSDVPTEAQLLWSGTTQGIPAAGIEVTAARRFELLTKDIAAVSADTALSSLLLYSGLALVFIAALSVA